ncbi:conserved hypothetical protein, partial [Perkinsus marinus ATCC 50983]
SPKYPIHENLSTTGSIFNETLFNKPRIRPIIKTFTTIDATTNRATTYDQAITTTVAAANQAASNDQTFAVTNAS